MIRIPRRTNAHPWNQRLARLARQALGASGVKTHAVHFAEIGSVRCKRVVFPHASEAAAVEAALEQLEFLDCLPGVVIRHGSELWTEYVLGDMLDPARHDGPVLLSAFFARLYAAGPELVSLESTPFPSRLRRDLRFLVESGYLDPGAASRLLARAQELAPAEAWVGHDYVDPLPKNFVVRDGRLVGVDVEAVQPGILLGTGLAKALLRWCPGGSGALLDAMRTGGGPDLAGQLGFADLAFRAAYAKQKTFQRKLHLAPRSMFDPWLAR